MKLLLSRYAYTPTETQGILRADRWECFTIERPWIRWIYPGGEPEKSCIPDGEYQLLPYRRSNKDKAFAMVNESLGVYFASVDRPKNESGERFGRFKCLIHGRANYVGDVKGCAAVGEARLIDRGRHELMVTNSTMTATALVNHIGWTDEHTIQIYQAEGALDKMKTIKEAARLKRLERSRVTR